MESDKATVPGDCFINITYPTKSDLEDTALVGWVRKYPRQTVTSDKVGPKDDQRSRLAEASSASKPGGKNVKSQDNRFSKESETAGQKLRSAADVISRLKHDRAFKIDEFKVGYVDRHSKTIIEKPAAEWVRETTHEEFIPEHRIECFTRYPTNGPPEVMWDKKIKLDKVFRDQA